jgi:hypothetical protein
MIQAAKVLVSVSAGGAALHEAMSKLSIMKTLSRLIADRQVRAQFPTDILCKPSKASAARGWVQTGNR